MYRKCNHSVMIRISWSRILAYIFVFLVFLNTGTACSLIYQISGDKRYVWIRMSLIFFSAFVVILLRKKSSFRRLSVAGLGIFLFSCINLMNYPKGAFSLLHLMLKLFLFMAVLLFLDETGVDIQNVIYQMVICICVCSLFLYILIDIFKMPIPFQTACLGDNSNDFYRFYLGGLFTDRDYAFVQAGPYVILRLQAFFCEPGMYGIFLVIALFYAWFVKKEKTRWKLGALLLNCILTFSTTCLALVSVLFFLKLWKESRKTVSKLFLVMMGLPAAAVFVYLIVSYKMSMISGSLRYQDLINGLRLFTLKPVFGIGIRNVAADELLQNGRANTNGFIFWLYTTGIFGIAVLLFPFIQNIRKTDQKFTAVLYLIVFVICNMTEPVTTLPYMTLLIAAEYEKGFKKHRCFKGDMNESGNGYGKEPCKEDLLLCTVRGEISAV